MFGNMTGAQRYGISRLSSGCRQWWHEGLKRWVTDISRGVSMWSIYRKKPLEKVVIHVTGGVAYVHKKTKGVEVTIRDFDNEAHR